MKLCIFNRFSANYFYLSKLIWDAVSGKVTAVVNAIKNTVTSVFNAIKSVASTVWNGIKSVISTVVDGIKSKVSSVFNAVKNTVSNVFNGIKNTATTVWNGIKNAITAPIEAAKNTIKGIVDTISGFFSGMKLELPKIKLPHFKITGKLSLAPPSVPRLSIDWYKEGGIMTRPTVFGMNGSSLMAGGEAGREAILPLKGFYSQLSAMLDQRLDMSGMEKYLAIIAENSGKGIYLDDGTLVGRILPAVTVYGEKGGTGDGRMYLSCCYHRRLPYMERFPCSDPEFRYRRLSDTEYQLRGCAGRKRSY